MTMSREPNKEIYEIINRWKHNSLLDDRGIIWSEERIWSTENLHQFRIAFTEQPDTSNNTFYEKLKVQLADENEIVYKLVIELLYLYYLIPKSTRYETKLDKLQTVADWKGMALDVDQVIFDSFKDGLIYTGRAFNSQINYEVSFIHQFAERIKSYSLEERKQIIKTPTSLKTLSDTVRKNVGRRVQMQHILLHLLLPDYFERIASWTDKKTIVKTFHYLIDDQGLEDIDDKIYYIKEELKNEYEDRSIDFYLTEQLKSIWKPEDQAKNYFWANILEKEYDQEGGIVGSFYNEKGNRKKRFNAYAKIAEDDYVVFFEIAPVQAITAIGKVKKIENTAGNKYIHYDVTTFIDPISWEEIKQDSALADSSVVRADNHGATLFEITKKQFEKIAQRNKTPIKQANEEQANDGQAEIPLPAISFDEQLDPEALGLIFENEDVLLDQIATALKKGDHIIFTGPPGTGKSKLAKQICDMYQVDAKMVTASSHWSTYDTIGGYRPNREGQLYFDAGIFLEAVKHKDTKHPKNEWVIVDEINRADIDQAFGSLFSVLTGDDVSLPFEAENGKKIELLLQDAEEEMTTEEHRYVIPKDWRMIGTMNTVDKASLFEMSYAFMRRFAFIPVGIPRNINESLVKRYLTTWKLDNYPYVKELTKLWKLINKYRKIGPAIVNDIARYTINGGDFISAIILYVLPQFEGLSEQKIEQFIQQLKDWPEIVPDLVMLTDFVEDFFQQGDF